MRLAAYCVCSTAHLPAAERDAFDSLVATAPRRKGRIVIDHRTLSIEAHQYGFAVHLGFFDDHPDRPDEVSVTLWDLLSQAKALGADWLCFDRDAPPTLDLPVFTDMLKATSTNLPETPVMSSKIMLCGECQSADVIRDASVRWDDAAQEWTLAAVFDAAWCEACGDTHLIEAAGKNALV